jgi:transposase
VTSQTERAVDLVGPMNSDQSWQARAENGFAIAQFAIDWEARQVTCPQGHTSISWLERHDARDDGMIHITFAKTSCAVCPVRHQCTQSATLPRRLQVHDRAQHAALLAARQRQQTEAFKASYARRYHPADSGALSEGSPAISWKIAPIQPVGCKAVFGRSESLKPVMSSLETCGHVAV